MLPAWKFKNVTQRSTSNMDEILTSRPSLRVQLQHDAGKFWGNIIFARSCKMLPFKHDLVQKVRQRSTSNSSEILMWRISLYSYNMMHVQLLRTYSVHKTTWPWASLNFQKGHTKVNVELVRDFDLGKIAIKLQHDTQSMKSYRIHKVPDVTCHLPEYFEDGGPKSTCQSQNALCGTHSDI